MPQLITVDARLPPSTAPRGDPENPTTIAKQLKAVELQTNADTQYDAKGNFREGFSATLTPQRKIAFVLVGICLALLVLIFPQPLPVRVVLGVGVIYGIHYILGKLVNHTV